MAIYAGKQFKKDFLRKSIKKEKNILDRACLIAWLKEIENKKS